MKRIYLVISLILALLVPISAPANAAVTWSQTSNLDITYDGTFYNPQYDLQYSSAYIFDNSTDDINLFLEFSQTPTVKMFNDGKGSYGAILFDYNKDGINDFELLTDDLDLTTDLTSIKGLAYNLTTSSFASCDVSIYTNINAGSKWVGFIVSRSCIGLPTSFTMTGYATYNPTGNAGSWDWAPYPSLVVNLPTASSSSSTTSTTPATGATYALPSNKANASTSANTYSDPPVDLSALSESLLPSVVTVKCANGSGTGWSADVSLSTALQNLGYRSLVVTNHHVIADCLTDKAVELVLNNGTSIAGTVVSWNGNDDVAGIAVKTVIPSLQWIGSKPKQGWWVGVLGSPLGIAGILTTGIISSVNSIASTFTFTAQINPGNSGGPVFDSTGRVLGLASSKNLISSGVLAEGFGNAQGVPLLCASIITCTVEKDPWGSVSKFSPGPTVAELAAAAEVKAAQEKAAAEAKVALDKAVADAKAVAAAEAKVALDKAVADAKAAAEAEAKIALEKAVADAKAAGAVETQAVKDQLSKFQGDFSTLSSNFASNLTKYNEALAQLEFLQGVIKTLQTQINELLKPKSQTIICTKGTAYKLVKGIAPKCPTGYKKQG